LAETIARHFVYCNGQDAEAFDGRIEFTVKLLPYTGSDRWVEGVLSDLKACLMSDDVPNQPADCEFCAYVSARAERQFTYDNANEGAQT
jgi:hypothetical protein